MRKLTWIAMIWLACGSAASGSDGLDGLDGFELSVETYEAWKQHIRPDKEELAWQQIDWLPDLKSGIVRASKIGRPILLWTMNGHPFGCT